MSPSPSARDLRRDRAQATPLWALVLVLAGLLLIPTAMVVRAGVERGRARTAADAAALAAAAESGSAGRSAAEALASANGATLETYESTGDGVEVTVRVGSHRATARAVREITRTPVTRPRRGP